LCKLFPGGSDCLPEGARIGFQLCAAKVVSALFSNSCM
jgi:hypothetical protein